LAICFFALDARGIPRSVPGGERGGGTRVHMALDWTSAWARRLISLTLMQLIPNYSKFTKFLLVMQINRQKIS